MPQVHGILETALYVADLARSEAFYQGLFGLPELARDERFCALGVAGRQVLLLFLQGGTLAPIELPGGTIGPHDARGQIHLAFAVAAEDLAGWREKLARHGVAVESEVRWPPGGTSVYFRDPDGHLVELATPGIWPGIDGLAA
jgi:catechol 2,3-dioxygenase-like lactoylglutathione lyase family enzyme